MKGIILAAGKGTRLGAATLGIGAHGVGVSKPLIPTYDKPTIHYPLADLISAGIQDILIIAAPDNVEQFKATLGDGSDLGISLSYAVQEVPRGIAEAFIIGEDFIGDDDVALIFGDNVFDGRSFSRALKNVGKIDGAQVFAYYVDNPNAFGVVEFDANGRAVSLEEKPAHPKSHYAVVGVYFYSADVVQIAKEVQPSDRGELEITSVNQAYLDQGRLSVTKLDSDTNWFDTGTPETLADATQHVRRYQQRNERLLGSPEAEAFRAGFISADQLRAHGERLKKSLYGQYLLKLADQGDWG